MKTFVQFRDDGETASLSVSVCALLRGEIDDMITLLADRQGGVWLF